MARHRSTELTTAEQTATRGKMHGRTRAEMASEEGVTRQAIKKRLSRARARLRDTQRESYARALSSPMKRVTLRPFSLQLSDNI